ncbi:hypothetical protein DMX11_11070 [Pseudomonas sp. LB-090624]|nr:hypothetical protein DMX11_11070 [Pseudomonas sp. LB-090624]
MGPELAEMLPDTEKFLKEEQSGGVVYSLYWEDATSRLTLPIGGVFIPHQNEVADYIPEEATLVERLASDWMLEVDPTRSKMRKFNIAPTILMPEKFDHCCEELGYERTLACIALLNMKRKAKGKTPFFNYRVLQVEAPRSGAASMGGHHASPRGHLRRGHIRRLQDRMVWVRPAFVSPSATGEMIHKDCACLKKLVFSEG